MTKTFTKLFLLFFIVLFSSQIDLAQTKIMVLGDRIADGTTAVKGEGLITFRRPLHVLLTTNGYNVDFVGSRFNQLQDFDSNHQSDMYLLDDHTDTLNILELADTTYNFLTYRRPNIVLLHAGYHDYRQGDNAEQMLKDLDSVFAEFEDYAVNRDSTVHYFVSTLVGSQEANDSVFNEFNEGMKTLIENWNGKAMIHLIDVVTESGFDPVADIYTDPKDFPTQVGYYKMAKVFYEHLSKVMTKGGTMPQLASPGNGSLIEQESVEFNWENLGATSEYRLQIAEDSLFTDLVVDSIGITDTTFTYSDLDSNTVYLWRVSAGGTSYSVANSFSFKSTPEIITVTAPTELSFEVSDSAAGLIELSWTDNSDNEEGFIIERKEGIGVFTAIDTVAAGVTTFNDSIVSEISFSYRVVAYLDSIKSEYSNLITILLSDVEDNSFMPTEYALEQNYPNPFNPSTTINYQLPFAGEVSLKVYDILGNEVSSLVDAYKPAGYHNVKFNAGNLSSGVYLYQIRVNNIQTGANFIATKKLLLVK